jgi:ABC-type uncharacterized transport system substrate-binding protein
MRWTVFLNLLEIYVARQKEHLLFNNDFYEWVIISLDEYKNGNFDIQEESQVKNKYNHTIDKMYTIKADNYTIIFEYDFDSSRPLKQTIKRRVVVELRFFDHEYYIEFHFDENDTVNKIEYGDN